VPAAVNNSNSSLSAMPIRPQRCITRVNPMSEPISHAQISSVEMPSWSAVANDLVVNEKVIAGVHRRTSHPPAPRADGVVCTRLSSLVMRSCVSTWACVCFAHSLACAQARAVCGCVRAYVRGVSALPLRSLQPTV
jgi:hypothetical protein